MVRKYNESKESKVTAKIYFYSGEKRRCKKEGSICYGS